MQAINFKNMFGVETRDNKGSELTWAEMDQNLKMLSMPFVAARLSSLDLKKLGEKLILIQDTDFNLYSNVGIGVNGDTCTLNEKFELDIQAAFLELENLNILENTYVVIPFTYSAAGINPYLRYTSDLKNFWVEFIFFKFPSFLVPHHDSTDVGPFTSYDFTGTMGLNEGDKCLLIAQVYWN